MYDGDNVTSPSAIILFDLTSRAKTTLLTSPSLMAYMQSDPTSGSVLRERSEIWFVDQLKQRADDKYRSTDLGLRSFQSGSVPNGVTPFVVGRVEKRDS
ncbi:hypothetical protein BTHE68_50360 [Burkholderia sp. THE68]|uniref:hypothetical protein n=1 Tax=Burkholderia sp. THE68 TaxID=758782 RepID=UPI001316C112|nr:hypothetical protein [Burkholderia sp. THE68]BBU31302.1 hypothetical protein BTHE68_50360 [Burkholderia sp. THE68]